MSKLKIRKLLLLYDVIVYAIVVLLLVLLHPSEDVAFTSNIVIANAVAGLVCIFGARFVFDVYRQIWRYGIMEAYTRLFFADVAGGALFILLSRILPGNRFTFVRTLSIICLNLLGAIAIRLVYYWLYQNAVSNRGISNISKKVILIAGGSVGSETGDDEKYRRKTNIAIVGAGKVGVGFAEELLMNPQSQYYPVCFIDTDKNKIGRMIHNVPILDEELLTSELLNNMGIQEVVFALPQLSMEKKKDLYEKYTKAGCKVKNYDFPTVQSFNNSKRTLREFDIEELLFRKPIEVADKETREYYLGKCVLVTGGGGSIGSELARQIARMHPSRLIILDVYENGAYDLQQSLKMAYGSELDLQVEICSVCDRSELERVFRTYRPEIVLHAAAHKHVPLMEHNISEAVKNNIFGTLNVVELSEKYQVEHFIMISTDKAVNPTNVMGATKRFCEMIVLSKARSSDSKTVFTATRFGNVLGSAGSVIPLFKKQIAAGGPVTVTDKRIIRYFMTIPEASQLVLKSGAIAENGELFVLDMGQPVKIYDLAENIIKLSGLTPDRDIEIVETGLRPGEKLYEELLIKGENTRKTNDEKIFVEIDEPVSMDDLDEKLGMLQEAIRSGDSASVRESLKKAVPTFYEPDEINGERE